MIKNFKKIKKYIWTKILRISSQKNALERGSLKNLENNREKKEIPIEKLLKIQ